MNTGNHEQNETAVPAAPGGWEPIPQSEGYDEGATAFVHLPPEFMLDGVPLEAPGHGYTPPMIVPLQPLAQPPEGVEPFAPEQGPEPLPHGYGDESAGAPVARPYVEHDPNATAEWHFGGTGQWEIPADEPAGYPAAPPVAPGLPEVPAHPEAAGLPVTPEVPVVPEVPGVPVGLEAPAAPEAAAVPVVPEVPVAPEAPVVPDVPVAPDVPVGPEAVDAGVPLDVPEAVSYEQAPPTLPGGAPAPWAVAEPEAAPAAGEPEPDHAHEAGHPDGADAGPAGPAAVPDAPVPSYTSVDSDEHPHTSYVLRVNGADRPVTDSWIGESLLYVLRERLGLAGAKDGCSQGECGACNVQVDGRLVASCLVPAATAAGSEVRTVEGLAVDGEPSDVQRALSRCGTVQCGFCIPGMCMTVHDLLEGNHAPTPLEARQALAGNLCRCSGYKGVLQAVEDVVAERAATAAEHATAGEDDASARIPHQHDGGPA